MLYTPDGKMGKSMDGQFTHIVASNGHQIVATNNEKNGN